MSKRKEAEIEKGLGEWIWKLRDRKDRREEALEGEVKMKMGLQGRGGGVLTTSGCRAAISTSKGYITLQGPHLRWGQDLIIYSGSEVESHTSTVLMPRQSVAFKPAGRA